MPKKFNIGDHVIVTTKGSIFHLNTKQEGIVTDIRVNRDNFEADSWIYYINGYDGVYYYDTHLEIDKKWLRDNKIDSILD